MLAQPRPTACSFHGNVKVAERLDEVFDPGSRRVRPPGAAGSRAWQSDPIRLLRTVPGVGRALAEMFHHKLGIDSLEDLEVAANDGTLEVFGGIGAKRLEGIRATLAVRLQSRRARADAAPPAPPSVAEFLDVDREYREKAAAGTLRMVAPRRMNPRGEAWLPVLHTRRGEREYTALFSNTPHAHRLGTTRDWVILHFDHDGSGGERQSTVITARFGPLKGQRIVRGREDECLRLVRRREWERAIGSDPERGPRDSPQAAATARWL